MEPNFVPGTYNVSSFSRYVKKNVHVGSVNPTVAENLKGRGTFAALERRSNGGQMLCNIFGSWSVDVGSK
jgi:hypothetical protein